MQLSSVYSLCITVNEDLDNGNGVLHLSKIWGSKAVTVFRGFNPTFGIVNSMCLFVLKVHLFLPCSRVYRMGGGVVSCTSQLCGNCGNIVRKHDMRYQFLG